MRVIKEFLPDFARLTVHEFSPSIEWAVSARLARECSDYTFSHHVPEIRPGGFIDDLLGVNQDLQNPTFDDASFDLLISQDVLEHVYDPAAAFEQIARVLRPGGYHVFTVPLVNGVRPSERRALLSESGEIIHLLEPRFHESSTSSEGSLVTIDWGYDIAGLIMQTTGMSTVILRIDDLDAGIRAELIEVLVSRKGGSRDHPEPFWMRQAPVRPER